MSSKKRGKVIRFYQCKYAQSKRIRSRWKMVPLKNIHHHNTLVLGGSIVITVNDEVVFQSPDSPRFDYFE